MTLNSGTGRGPIPGPQQAPSHPPGVYQQSPPAYQQGPQTIDDLARRRNNFRDLAALVLLLLAPLFPWNLYFGLQIPGSRSVVWVLVGLVTLLSLLSLLLSRARKGPAAASTLRVVLNMPYLVLLAFFVLFDVFESVKFGGQVHVPGGIGPGGWLGIAGALLAAQPVLTNRTNEELSYPRWLQAARVIGYASMFGASLSVGFNLCWAVRYGLQRQPGQTEQFGTSNIIVIVTGVVYGLVALTALLVASRWILRNTAASRFATFALGASALLAGMIVWLIPLGRQIDSFHGIAQDTPRAGVGYEGYLAWVAAAALFVPMTLFGPPGVRADRDVWRGAIRHGLTLIVVWCLGSALMRINDLGGAAMIDFPTYPYNRITLAVFDVTTAGLALWLRVKVGGGPLRSRLIAALSTLLFALTVSRVFLGVVLAIRFPDTPNRAVQPVYGNDFAQQITSTFDVTLCGLALSIFVAIIIAGGIRKTRRRVRRPLQRPGAAQRPPVPIPTRPGVPPPSEARTTQFGAARPQHDAPTSVLSAPPGNAPRIFRPEETTGPIFRPPRNPS
nr:hypothetical protein [Mycobacterium asiaticum]